MKSTQEKPKMSLFFNEPAAIAKLNAGQSLEKGDAKFDESIQKTEASSQKTLPLQEGVIGAPHSKSMEKMSQKEEPAMIPGIKNWKIDPALVRESPVFENPELESKFEEGIRKSLEVKKLEIEKDKNLDIKSQEVQKDPVAEEPEKYIELMKEQEDIRAHNMKDVEYRKFLKSLEIKEGSERQLFLEGNNLISRIARCLNKKLCSYLEASRCDKLGLEMSKKDRLDLERRDWEGQDNMKQFVKESPRFEERKEGLSIRETRDMKADRRSQSPERTKEGYRSSSSGTSTPESEGILCLQERHQEYKRLKEEVQSKKDRGLAISDADLKMLDELRIIKGADSGLKKKRRRQRRKLSKEGELEGLREKGRVMQEPVSNIAREFKIDWGEGKSGSAVLSHYPSNDPKAEGFHLEKDASLIKVNIPSNSNDLQTINKSKFQLSLKSKCQLRLYQALYYDFQQLREIKAFHRIFIYIIFDFFFNLSQSQNYNKISYIINPKYQTRCAQLFYTFQ